LINVETKLSNPADYDALGYFAGEIAGIDVPVFNGIKGTPGLEELKGFGASQASSGGVGLYHVVGVTPEAPTVDTAFQGDKPEETVSFTEKDLKETYDTLSTHGSTDVDYVALGCPHLSIKELMKVAELLKGKKVDENVHLWLLTVPMIRWQAEMMGIRDVIRAAGGRIATVCWSSFKPTPTVLATDSGKTAHYAPAHYPKADFWFGSLEQCIETALTGRWRR
jgi:predicted aconitase